MNPQDDPEERIRQLEQARSADSATELGVSQPGPNYSYVPPTQPDSYVPPTTEPTSSAPPYPAPYPPPPPPTQPWSYPPPPDQGGFTPGPVNFGTSFPPPTRSSSGRWIIFLPILIGMIALAGGVIFYVSQTFHGIQSITSNPGGFITSSPTRHSTLQPPSPQSDEPTVSPTPAIPSPGGGLSVTGIGETKTIACNDGAATVSGSSNTVTFTGHCTSVDVSGIDNTVTVDAADEITASGIDNHVVYHSGSPGKNNSGIQNTIEQG